MSLKKNNYTFKLSFITYFSIISLVCSVGCSEAPSNPQVNHAILVNTQIGNKGKPGNTDKRYHEAGFTFPGATYPFGMVQFTPTFFNPNKGFVINQLSGAGCEHMGNLPLLPLKGEISESPDDMMHFDPGYDIQESTAGFYKATLFDDVTAELTVTKRTGIAKIIYPDTLQKGTVIIGTGINATKMKDASVKIITPNSFEGYADGGSFCGADSNYKIYFVGKFKKDAQEYGTWENKYFNKQNRKAGGANSGVFFTFDVSDNKELQYEIGVSYVSIENARENLESEKSDFEEVKENTLQKWNEYLKKIEINDTTSEHAGQFYTHLYHALIHPSLFSDINGEYIGADGEVHYANNFDFYTAFSNWDTYRTQIQLLSILFPEKASDIVTSHLEFAEQSGGGFPRWVLANRETGIMQGDPTSILIANAYAFGATDFDTKKALKIMLRGAEEPGTKSQKKLTRPQLSSYLENGYTGNASITLEYTSSDFAIAQFAKQALDDEVVRNKYKKRAQNWKKLYNPETFWLQSRHADGSWKDQELGFREGTYKDYFWMVPYNLSGLIDTLGGNEVAVERLDNYFTQLDADYDQTWFAAGNEPSFQAPWTFNWTEAPHKTQALVRRIVQEQYSLKDNGLPGNDDLGAMGAWYVFANMGLYPMIPGIGGFSISTPLFERIKIDLPDGELVITSGSKSHSYIESLELNGKKYNSTWIQWDELKNGGTLEFETSEQAIKDWGNENPPPSFR
ncbi:GH92 family glycosyl hydrolase [Autumnicola musiva]|uniref:GH92 family glycosyl hydrolase n=1 Tax=Autumnicola musiva TaxID=3075589 RepID=A0ABU3D9X5_9FLAO|nr:GH92 family glycosyl hydrolase [Zunongwangia sp. F117]MDT0678342.1 GH92 family glycosyl hydrolase [Zunongwangia sp. F117]